jgi:hypothetical protein
LDWQPFGLVGGLGGLVKSIKVYKKSNFLKPHSKNFLIKNVQMKTFNDIEITPHPLSKLVPEMNSAVMGLYRFDNGFKISITGGYGICGDGIDTFEVAIFKPNRVWYESKDTEVVKTYVTKDEITKIMYNIQKVNVEL